MAVTHDFAAARRETLTSLPMYFNMLQGQAAPYMTDFARAGATGGMSLSQDYRSALGRIGGAGTGAGAVSGSLSSTLAGSLSAQLRMKFFEMLQNSAVALQTGGLQAGTNGKTPGNPYLMSGIGAATQIGAQFIKPRI